MKTGESGEPRGKAESAARVAWQMGMILAAASVLGLSYNRLSPLGVRNTSPTATPVPLNVSNLPAPIPQSVPGTNATAQLPANEATTATVGAAWQPGAPLSTALQQAVATVGEFKFPELKWPEVKARLAAGQVVLLDARLAETFALSHIPGAVSLPAYSPPEQLHAFATNYPRSTPFVLYCNSDTCDMSHELAAKLARQYGFTNLMLMPGGYAEYLIAEPGGNLSPSR